MVTRAWRSRSSTLAASSSQSGRPSASVSLAPGSLPLHTQLAPWTDHAASLPPASITRKDPWTFSVVLSAIVRELEGTMVVRIKRPPTNRIWYAFTTMPRIVLDLEPVLGPRQVKWSMITKPIESRLRELVCLPPLHNRRRSARDPS